MSEGRSLSIEELTALRGKTERVSAFLRERLEGYLATIRTALAPRWVLGKHVRSGVRDDIVGSDKAYEKLREGYTRYRGRPFLLPRELEEGPVSIEGVIELQPWEYTLELDGKPIKVISPTRWVANYRCGYTLEQIRESIAAKQGLRSEDARAYVLGALTLAMLLEKQPGITDLLTDLRYRVEVTPNEELGGLPLVTIAAGLPSFRPADEVILAATRFSGVPEFIEPVDVEAVASIGDPLREAIEELLAGD